MKLFSNWFKPPQHDLISEDEAEYAEARYAQRRRAEEMFAAFIPDRYLHHCKTCRGGISTLHVRDDSKCPCCGKPLAYIPDLLRLLDQLVTPKPYEAPPDTATASTMTAGTLTEFREPDKAA